MHYVTPVSPTSTKNNCSHERTIYSTKIAIKTTVLLILFWNQYTYEHNNTGAKLIPEKCVGLSQDRMNIWDHSVVDLYAMYSGT